jgi:hypothetical protein
MPSVLHPNGKCSLSGLRNRYKSEAHGTGASASFPAFCFAAQVWNNREDHVSPQALVSVRTINLNGVAGATARAMDPPRLALFRRLYGT